MIVPSLVNTINPTSTLDFSPLGQANRAIQPDHQPAFGEIDFHLINAHKFVCADAGRGDPRIEARESPTKLQAWEGILSSAENVDHDRNSNALGQLTSTSENNVVPALFMAH